MECPVGSISSLTKGRVGLLAGAGLYIDFKQGIESLKLDTKSEEADLIVSTHGLIMSGQVDDEMQKNGKAPTEETKLITCPRCGAPYTDEIYKGQVTVNCRYCGSSIAV
jgi:DNA-directed RNA polymerase subunit RPC12/RpoP